MNVPTIPGQTYVVTTVAECTVTCDINGLIYTLCTAASGQAAFCAPSDSVTISDDTAIVTPAFKSAALAVLGGGGTSEPEGDYAVFDSAGVIVDGRLDKLVDGAYLQSYKPTLTKWDIPLPSLENGRGMFLGISSSSEIIINALVSWNVDLPSLKNGNSMFSVCKNLSFFKSKLPNLTTANQMFNSSRFESFDTDMPVLWNANSMFSNNNNLISFKANISAVTSGGQAFYNCTSLEVFESELPVLSSASNMFYGCKLNKVSALRVLNSIPTITDGVKHYLTIGVHVDFKTDEEVLAAISAAESKGWTMTVQWNGKAGTSAASTYSMRGELIYARVVEENGERILDWGHYVTDPTGYEEFRSVEAAREYFGISPDEFSNQ